jgi:PAS domain S-box-containing protein
MTNHDLTELKRLQERATRFRTLERLNRLVSSSLTYEEVLGAIARAAADLMDTPCVSFWMVDEATRMVRVAAWSEPSMGDDFPTRPRAMGQGAIGRIAETGETVNVPDSFQGRVLAVLALNGRTPFVPSEDDQDLLQSLIAQAAVAIHNAMLFREAESRRQAAEAAEARYRALFEANVAGILRTKIDGRILDCNEAMVRILRYGSREALQAKSVVDLYVDPSERGPVVEAIRTGERLSNIRFHWRRADGTTATVLGNVAVMRDPVHGVVLDGILVDISDRERFEETEREAEALRAVARLANAAAHEINNPLAVISGHLTILERRLAADPDVVARIEKARAAWKKIAEIITRMGRITRLELSSQTPGLPPILDLRRSADEPGEAADPTTR